MQTILLITALIGMTLLIVRSVVFAPLRKLWPAFFGCAQCVGTWVGAAAGASGIIETNYVWWADAVIVGASVSFLALLSDAILLRLLGEPES